MKILFSRLLFVLTLVTSITHSTNSIIQLSYSPIHAQLKILELYGNEKLHFKEVVDPKIQPLHIEFLKLVKRLDSRSPITTGDRTIFGPNNTSIYELILYHASQTSNMIQFKSRINGLLKQEDQERLIYLLNSTKLYSSSWLKVKAEVIEEFQNKANQYLNKPKNIQLINSIKKFYRSTWSDQKIPVALFPVPNKARATTSKSRVFFTEVTIQNGQLVERKLSTIIHEICHTFFATMSKSLIEKFSEYTNITTNIFTSHMILYLNEGLATSIGNSIFYEKLTNQKPKGSLYENKVIDGFAKAIKPLLLETLNRNESITKSFLNKSIKIFKKAFPEINKKVVPVFSKVLVLNESTISKKLVQNQIDRLIPSIGRYFQYGSPASHPFSVKDYNNCNYNPLFLLDSLDKSTVHRMSKAYPKIKPYLNNLVQNKLKWISFIDDKDRANIIFVGDSQEFTNSLKEISALSYIADHK